MNKIIQVCVAHGKLAVLFEYDLEIYDLTTFKLVQRLGNKYPESLMKMAFTSDGGIIVLTNSSQDSVMRWEKYGNRYIKKWTVHLFKKGFYDQYWDRRYGSCFEIAKDRFVFTFWNITYVVENQGLTAKTIASWSHRCSHARLVNGMIMFIVPFHGQNQSRVTFTDVDQTQYHVFSISDVVDVVVSCQGRIAFGCVDEVVRIYQNYQQVCALSLPHISSLSFSPDGQLLVAHSKLGKCVVISMALLMVIKEFGGMGRSFLCISPSKGLFVHQDRSTSLKKMVSEIRYFDQRCLASMLYSSNGGKWFQKIAHRLLF